MTVSLEQQTVSYDPSRGLPAMLSAGVTVTDGVLSVAQTEIGISPVTALYRISLYLTVTIVGTAGSVSAALFWLDAAGIGRTIASEQASLSPRGYAQLTTVAQVAQGMPMNYSVTVSGDAAGNWNWQLYITAEQLTGAING